MTRNEFIEEIAKAVKKYAPEFGICVYSPVIAQACLESAYGTSNKAKYNNFFGLKFRKNRVKSFSGFFYDDGSEQKADGSYVPINTAWYMFENIELGVLGYFEFLNIDRYKNLKGITEPRKYLETIKEDGYATSLNYVSNIMRVIETNNLTKYDRKGEEEVMSLNIINKTSTHNTTYLQNRKIEYIVLHYTAGTSSKAGTAQNTANYFSTTTRQASADFIVDDGNIVQYNSDINNRYCWSVGGSKYTKKYTSESGKYYGICKNRNSISIEMCSRKTNSKTLNAEDTDWYLTESTINNAIELTKYLMKTYNIDTDHVIMHHQVTGKPCPNPFCINESRLVEWNKFKSKLTKSSVPTITPPTTTTTTRELYRVRKSWNDAGSQIGAYSILENAKKNCPDGYSVYDSKGNVVYSKNTSYIVQITASTLNVRAGAGTGYKITTTVKKNQKYTIVEEKNGWGKLKSGAGWISLKYTKKV